MGASATWVIRSSIDQTSLMGSPRSACDTAGNFAFRSSPHMALGFRSRATTFPSAPRMATMAALRPSFCRPPFRASHSMKAASRRAVSSSLSKTATMFFRLAISRAWMAASAARRRPISANARSARATSRSTCSVAPFRSPCVIEVYIPIVTSSMTTAAASPIFIRCMASLALPMVFPGAGGLPQPPDTKPAARIIHVFRALSQAGRFLTRLSRLTYM